MTMTNRMRKAQDNLAKLPKECWSVSLTSKALIKITAGQDGYHPIDKCWADEGLRTFECSDYSELADTLNKQSEISKAQRKAMEIGSLSGWHVTGADPDVHE